MGRTFVVVAALAAFMVSMSACKCPAPAPAAGSSGGSSGGGAAAAGTAGGGTVCLDAPSAKDHDGTSTYRPEKDRHMSNMVDRRP